MNSYPHNNGPTGFNASKNIYLDKYSKFKDIVGERSTTSSSRSKQTKKYSSDRFCSAPMDLYEDEEITRCMIQHYSIFNFYAKLKGVCWVSNASLIDKFARISDDSIKRTLPKLQKKRLIFRIHVFMKNRGGSIRMVVTRCSYRQFCDHLNSIGEQDLAQDIYLHFNPLLDDESPIEGQPTEPIETESEKIQKYQTCSPGRVILKEGGHSALGCLPTYIREEYIRTIASQDEVIRLDLKKSLKPEQVKDAMQIFVTMSPEKKKKIHNMAAYLTKIVKMKEMPPTCVYQENQKTHINEILKKFGDFFEQKCRNKVPHYMGISSLSKGLEIASIGNDPDKCYQFFDYSMETDRFFDQLTPICMKYGLTDVLPDRWRTQCRKL